MDLTAASLQEMQTRFNQPANTKKVKAANGKHSRKYRWCNACERVVRWGGRHDRRIHAKKEGLKYYTSPEWPGDRREKEVHRKEDEPRPARSNFPERKEEKWQG